MKHMERALLIALLVAAPVSSLSAQGLHWRHNPESGRWSMGAEALDLRDAVASVRIGSERVAMEGPVKVGPAAPVEDALGRGERFAATAPARNGVELSLSITTYRTKPRALIEATLRNVSNRPLIVTDFCAFQGKVATIGPAQGCRVFRNSGSQGVSGVFPLGDKGTHTSAYVTCLLDPEAKRSLGIGMVSYRRADATITTRTLGAHELEIIASASFSNLPIAPGGGLSSEAFLLEWGADPLAVLEGYADALAALHKIKVPPEREGLWNVWYAYDEKENSEDNLLKCADYQARHLVKWGIPWLITGVWQRDNAFGEDRVKPDLYPRDLKWLGDEMRRRGVKPNIGGFFAKVTDTTPLFRDHPEFMVKTPNGEPLMVGKESWGRCPHPYYFMDITHPGAQEWYRRLWRSFVDWGYRGYFWIDFEGTSAAGTRHNANLNAPFETDRLRLKIIREAVGNDAHLGTYTSPTNRYLGLADRVRMASDVGRFGSGSNWQHLRNVARNMAAAWLYHNRVWVNDPDPPMVGLRAEAPRLEEARIRLLLVAMSGGFITLGERMPEMDPAQFRLLTTILPPYPEAARPVDLFRNEVPEVQDLTVRTDWDTWHVVSLVNWDDPVKPDVRVEADSEFIAGNGVPYAARHAYDGSIGVSLASPTTCWAADSKKPGPHWIAVSFPEPQELNEVSIHWTNYRGFDPQVEWWTSAHYLIQVWRDKDWETLADVRNEVPVAGLPVTTHRFPQIRTDRVRLLQPEGGGPPRRKDMLAIGEIELLPASLRPKEVHVDFAELGLRPDVPFLVYEFWSQKLLGEAKNSFTLSLLPHTCRLLCIRPVPERPWILSTDLHISQGGVELRDVQWNPDSG